MQHNEWAVWMKSTENWRIVLLLLHSRTNEIQERENTGVYRRPSRWTSMPSQRKYTKYDWSWTISDEPSTMIISAQCCTGCSFCTDMITPEEGATGITSKHSPTFRSTYCCYVHPLQDPWKVGFIVIISRLKYWAKCETILPPFENGMTYFELTIADGRCWQGTTFHWCICGW